MKVNIPFGRHFLLLGGDKEVTAAMEAKRDPERKLIESLTPEQKELWYAYQEAKDECCGLIEAKAYEYGVKDGVDTYHRYLTEPKVVVA